MLLRAQRSNVVLKLLLTRLLDRFGATHLATIECVVAFTQGRLPARE